MHLTKQEGNQLVKKSGCQTKVKCLGKIDLSYKNCFRVRSGFVKLIHVILRQKIILSRGDRHRGNWSD